MRSDLDELDLCESQLDAIKPDGGSSPFGVPPHSAYTLQSAFGVLAEVMPPDTALNTIETILRRLSSESATPDDRQQALNLNVAAQDGGSSEHQ